VVAALSAASPAAVASGSAVTATLLTADPVSEVPLPVEITGVAHVPSTLTVGWAELHEGCYSPLVADEVLDDLPVSGAFSMRQAGIVLAPGSHVLCAFLEDDRNKTVAASVAPFTARPPAATLWIDAPAVAALGRRVRIRVRGTAEAPRHASAKLAPPGLPCDAALDSIHTPRLGLQENTMAFDLNGTIRLDQYGTWKVCAKADRYHAVVDPTDTYTEVPIRVTVPCTAASRELSRARDRWRALSRRLRLRGLPPSSHLRIRGMAVRRARAWVERACAPGS
jgi:hypothetical protein